jgi:ABC-type uncharacterized transport system ATPase subunit
MIRRRCPLQGVLSSTGAVSAISLLPAASGGLGPLPGVALALGGEQRRQDLFHGQRAGADLGHGPARRDEIRPVGQVEDLLVLAGDEDDGRALVRQFGKVLLSRQRETARVQAIVDQVQVRPPDLRLEVGGLSGGNQQKVLIAKWMVDAPRLIIFDEPTRGVDIDSKVAIYGLINNLADQGAAVVLISSEHEEILNLADRAYLVSEGRTVAEVRPRELTVEQVLEALFAAQGHSDPQDGAEAA